MLKTVLLFSVTMLGQAQSTTSTQHHGRITGDLAEALGAVAVQLQVPIMAELAMPLPHDFNLLEGNHTAEELLNSLVAHSQGYSWQWEGRVAHVYNRRLLKAPANFLDLRLESFSFPGNVAELSVTLRNTLWQCSISEKIAGHRRCLVPFGFPFAGFWPTALEPLRLTPRIGAGSARQVVLDAASENGQFYSIIVFPRPYARTAKDAEFAFFHWAWHPLSDAASPFPLPFSYYGKTFRAGADLLLGNLVTHVTTSRHSPNVLLFITVNERGRIEQVRPLKGSPRKAKLAVQAARLWRFKPDRLNGLPVRLICDLPVEVAEDGSVHPTTKKEIH